MMAEMNIKVLIVSHNVIDNTSGMGKTLRAYFRNFGPENVAQFYIHPDEPTEFDVCRYYYRFTDVDAIKARVPGFVKGHEFCSDEPDSLIHRERAIHGATESVYQYGRKRTGIIYSGREAVWKTSFWNTRTLKEWVRKFAPDIVFFASGDYAFMYDIAVKIADLANCPLIVSCMDDYYTSNINDGTWIGRRFHSYFMRAVKRTMKRADRFFCMCDQMSDIYSGMFHRPTETLYTPASTAKDAALRSTTDRSISYIGRLGVGRYKSLIDIGKALHDLKISDGPDHIDIYASEKRREVIDMLNCAAGVKFHGAVSAEQVSDVMQESMMVIHTESFEDRYRRKVKFSISTKIAESLVNGPCIFAYGPSDIASIEYLKKNGAAVVATDKDQLGNVLLKAIQGADIRRKCVQNARTLGSMNHDPEKIYGQLNSAFLQAIESERKRK